MQPTQNVEDPVPLPSASGPQIRSRIAAPPRPAYKFTCNLKVKAFTKFVTGCFESIQVSTGQSL
jgi:hypothetical protein